MITSETFKTLTDDLCFKYVFSKDIILKDFIDSFLTFINSNKRFDYTKIVPENYIMPDNKEYSLYIGDLVATTTDDSISSIEMYRNTFTINDYLKSKAYMYRLFDQNIKKNDYKNAKKVYSINLIKGNFKKMNNEIVNTYCFSNSLSHKSINEGYTIMYLIRFDKVKNIPYNEDEERFITWLRLINAKDLEEMQNYIRKDDKIMTETQKFVAEWNRKSAKNGLERYINKVKQESIDAGLSQGILQTAKNMLNLNLDVADIIKATGLSRKELTNLQKQIKED